MSGASSWRALARSRPTPSLPHAPRAPLLVSSTLLDAMSQCTCAAHLRSAARAVPPLHAESPFFTC
jgi:hypothetical protein